MKPAPPMTDALVEYLAASAALPLCDTSCDFADALARYKAAEQRLAALVDRRAALSERRSA